MWPHSFHTSHQYVNNNNQFNVPNNKNDQNKLVPNSLGGEQYNYLQSHHLPHNVTQQVHQPQKPNLKFWSKNNLFTQQQNYFNNRQFIKFCSPENECMKQPAQDAQTQQQFGNRNKLHTGNQSQLEQKQCAVHHSSYKDGQQNNVQQFLAIPVGTDQTEIQPICHKPAVQHQLLYKSKPASDFPALVEFSIAIPDGQGTLHLNVIKDTEHQPPLDDTIKGLRLPQSCTLREQGRHEGRHQLQGTHAVDTQGLRRQQNVIHEEHKSTNWTQQNFTTQQNLESQTANQNCPDLTQSVHPTNQVLDEDQNEASRMIIIEAVQLLIAENKQQNLGPLLSLLHQLDYNKNESRPFQVQESLQPRQNITNINSIQEPSEKSKDFSGIVRFDPSPSDGSYSRQLASLQNLLQRAKIARQQETICAECNFQSNSKQHQVNQVQLPQMTIIDNPQQQCNGSNQQSFISGSTGIQTNKQPTERIQLNDQPMEYQQLKACQSTQSTANIASYIELLCEQLVHLCQPMIKHQQMCTPASVNAPHKEKLTTCAGNLNDNKPQVTLLSLGNQLNSSVNKDQFPQQYVSCRHSYPQQSPSDPVQQTSASLTRSQQQEFLNSKIQANQVIYKQDPNFQQTDQSNLDDKQKDNSNVNNLSPYTAQIIQHPIQINKRIITALTNSQSQLIHPQGTTLFSNNEQQLDLSKDTALLKLNPCQRCSCQDYWSHKEHHYMNQSNVKQSHMKKNQKVSQRRYSENTRHHESNIYHSSSSDQYERSNYLPKSSEMQRISYSQSQFVPSRRQTQSVESSRGTKRNDSNFLRLRRLTEQNSPQGQFQSQPNKQDSFAPIISQGQLNGDLPKPKEISSESNKSIVQVGKKQYLLTQNSALSPINAGTSLPVNVIDHQQSSLNPAESLPVNVIDHQQSSLNPAKSLPVNVIDHQQVTPFRQTPPALNSTTQFPINYSSEHSPDVGRKLNTQLQNPKNLMLSSHSTQGRANKTQQEQSLAEVSIKQNETAENGKKQSRNRAKFNGSAKKGNKKSRKRKQRLKASKQVDKQLLPQNEDTPENEKSPNTSSLLQSKLPKLGIVVNFCCHGMNCPRILSNLRKNQQQEKQQDQNPQVNQCPSPKCQELVQCASPREAQEHSIAPTKLTLCAAEEKGKQGTASHLFQQQNSQYKDTFAQDNAQNYYMGNLKNI